jgi:predicted permease
MNTPPRLALLLLRLTIPEADVREGVLGDLEEDLACLAEAGTPPSHPHLWYWRAILGLSARFTLKRLTSTGRSPNTSPAEQRREKLSMFETLRQDLVHSYRSLRRDAGLAVLAVAIVGLGIGACITVFSVANALLIRPLPFDDPEELVLISNGDWGAGEDLSGISVQVSHLWDLQNEARLLSDAAGYFLFDRVMNHTLTGSGEPERLSRLSVTHNFLPLLGVQPQIGRLFTEDEAQWNGPILLTHGFWVRRFGADPDAVGRTLTIENVTVTVAGVLPPSFDFPTVFAPGTKVDFLAPFPLDEEWNNQGNTLALVGRLRPGATVQAAQAEAAQLAQRPYEGEARRNRFDPRFTPLRDHVSGTFRPAVLLLAGAVGLVMLIVCTNLSNLLLARGATREKELAIRAALGAERRRLLRQMLTESLALAVAGATLGLLLALVGTRALARLDFSIPLLTGVRLDGVALGFTIGMALVTGIVFGLAPAVRLSAVAVHESLKESGRGHSIGRRGGWIRGALVTSQVALCCVLLVGAGLLVRSFLRVLDVDLGFQPRGVLAMRIDPPTEFPNDEEEIAFYDEALRRVQATPGVEVAGLTDVLPTAFNRRWGAFRVGERSVMPFVRIVSEGYVEALGLSLVAGRDLSSGDNLSTGTSVLVNEAMARILWPDENPVGQTFQGWSSWGDVEVVGIVRGMRYLHPEQDPGPELFLSIRQVPSFGPMHVVVRGPHSLTNLAAALRETLRPLDPNLPVNETSVIQDLVDQSLSPRRFVLLLLAGFAGFALLLAALGLYGVISFSVSQRTREIGIRSALGASPWDLRRRVMTDTLGLAGAGMTLGLAGAWMLGRVLQGFLFAVPSTDPATYLGVAALVLTVAALAGYRPARRATKVDPIRALGAQGSSST